MTYIERAFFDFTRSVIVSGAKTLVHPKYLPFTLSSLIIVFASTILSFFGNQIGLNLATPENLQLFLSLEISIGISFLLAGLLFSRLNYVSQLLIIFLLTVSFFVLFANDILPVDSIGYIAAVLFVLWIILGSLSQYSFFRDFFGHPIIGGILFLGKQRDDGKVIFRGFVAIITIFNIGLGYVVLKDAIDLGLSYSYVILGGVIIFAGIINLFPLLHIQSSGDVFFSTLTWFYSLGTIRVVNLAFRLLSKNDTSNNTLLDLGITLFLILVAVHKATSSGKKVEEQLAESKELSLKDPKKKKSKIPEEHNPIQRMINKVFQDRGIVLIILGSALGYHTTIVQFRLGEFNLLSNNAFNADIPWPVISHEVAIFTYLTIYLLTIAFFLLIPGFRRYSNPEIIRLTWLPEYPDMKNLVIGMKEGKVDYKLDLLKLAASMSKDQIAKTIGIKKDTDHESSISKTLNRLVRKSKKDD